MNGIWAWWPQPICVGTGSQQAGGSVQSGTDPRPGHTTTTPRFHPAAKSSIIGDSFSSPGRGPASPGRDAIYGRM